MMNSSPSPDGGVFLYLFLRTIPMTYSDDLFPSLAHITTNQIESLLKEASLEYVKTGANAEEVQYYTMMLIRKRDEQDDREFGFR